MRFKDKIAVVTGGGSGIGRETALRFAREGAAVALLDVNLGNAEKVAAELRALKTDPVALKCDVADSTRVRECFEAVIKKYGTVDILFNNAGVVKGGLVHEMDDETWLFNININLNGTFYCNREALKAMVPKRSGKIVNMSSIWGGVSDRGGMPAFSASKAGIVGFTRCVGIQMAKYNINVNAVAPGYVNTPIHSEEFKKARYPQLARETPIGRVGEPEDIAAAVLFLCSEEASFICGQTISPNGGLVV